MAELLDDPLVGLVMKSDGVDRQAIERLFEPPRTRPERLGPDPAAGTPPK